MASSAPPNTKNPWYRRPWSSKVQAIAGLFTLVTIFPFAYEHGPRLYGALTTKPLTDVQRAELQAWARQTAVDGVVTSKESQDLERFVARNRLRREEVDRFLAEVEEPIGQSADLVRQGVALVGQREFREAHDRFLLATARDAENVRAWVNLGGARLELGLPESAREALGEALELQPDRWTAHYNLGASFAASGRAERALEHLEHSLELAHSMGLTEKEKGRVLRDLAVSRWLDSLRELPRFEALLEHEALARERTRL